MNELSLLLTFTLGASMWTERGGGGEDTDSNRGDKESRRRESN